MKSPTLKEESASFVGESDHSSSTTRSILLTLGRAWVGSDAELSEVAGFSCRSSPLCTRWSGVRVAERAALEISTTTRRLVIFGLEFDNGPAPDVVSVEVDLKGIQ